MRFITILLPFLISQTVSNPTSYNEEQGVKYLQKLNEDNLKIQNKVTLANWDYASNITDENLNKMLELQAEYAKFEKNEWFNIQKYPWKTFKNPDVRRHFKKFSILGTAALSEEKYARLGKIISQMEEIYSKAKICDFKNKQKCDLSLEPELVDILANSNDPNELAYVWSEWRSASGKKMKKIYIEYVELMNEAAKLNNFSDSSELWLEGYETEDIRRQFETLWNELKPYYLQVHAFVRNELRKLYGDNVVSEKGPIPASLLGNMWAQTWSNIASRTLPFPDKKPDDITSEMLKQNYTPLKMFKLAEQFFVSLNLSAMPETFWKNSIIEKPNDREMVCHASAWDMYDGKDFRIKMCTMITSHHLSVVHHEMGHVQYYIQYRNLPLIYRRGGNPGFHEAIGDVMSLSVETTKHLRRIGLIKSDKDDIETHLNHLYSILLDKVVFLPFGYLMDIFRWNIFEGKIKPEQYNCEWWKLRQDYQGVEPPVDRNSNDFDPGAKYHIAADVPYIRYFVSFIIQFQFHKALCEKAGQYVRDDPSKPLYQCDIYQNVEAGNALRNMLQMGSSKPWPDAMEVLTGERTMSANGLLEYFKPILDYITKKNKENKVHIGWAPSTKKFGCPS